MTNASSPVASAPRGNADGLSPVDGSSFELDAVDGAAWRRNRGRRRQVFTVLVGGPVLAALAVALAVKDGPGSGPFYVLLGVSALLGAMAAAMGRFSGVPLGHGPRQLRVDAVSLRLDFPGGRAIVRPWTAARPRLRLADFRGIPTPYRRQVPCELTLDRTEFALTAEAFEAVRAAAERSGLRVRSRSYEGHPGWQSHFYEVEPAALPRAPVPSRPDR